MKKFLSLALAFILTILLVPTNVEAATAKAVKLNKSSMTIYVGAKTTLKNTGTAKNIKWSSTKPNVASVSKKGVVTAKKAGKTVIVAKYGNKKAKCTVTVKKNLNAKQVFKKLDKQLNNTKNLTIKAYIKSINKNNMYMEMGVNIKTQLVYMDMSSLGLPKMYISGNKVYWQELETNDWFYYTDESASDDEVDTDDIMEDVDDDAEYKLLSNRTFNGKKCAALRIVDSSDVIVYYFDLANYNLVGASQGSGAEKILMTIDTKTTVKVPAKIKRTATYKEFSFE